MFRENEFLFYMNKSEWNLKTGQQKVALYLSFKNIFTKL